MKNLKINPARRSLVALSVSALIWALCLADSGAAQYVRGGRTIDAGTTITVRTNETISARDSDGRIFSGVVEQNVRNRSGNVAIPRGSDVELIVRRESNQELSLDMESILINGQRYGLDTDDIVVGTDRKESLGANDRTGKFVGGGALLGAIIGAIAGGGKGAAIGAGAGAAAGASTQVLTRGSSVRVPPESLITFRLAQPLRPARTDSGYMNNGVHYHLGYPDGQTAANNYRQKPGYFSNGRPDIHIGYDKNVSWQGPNRANVYVTVDRQAPKLFASGPSGRLAAPWITPGHLYVFVLKDGAGNEIARDEEDLRTRR